MQGVLDQKFQLVDIDSVRPHPQNPREGDVGMIHESIEANGFFGALIVQKSTGHIIVGSHRWKAAKLRKLAKLPALIVDVDDALALRIMLAENRANDLASYNSAALADLLKDLNASEAGLEGTLFTVDELDELLKELQATTRFGQEPPAAVPKLDGWEPPAEALRIIIECSTAEEIAALQRFLGIEDGLDRVRYPFSAARRLLAAKHRDAIPTCTRCNAGSGARVGLLPKQEEPTAADFATWK